MKIEGLSLYSTIGLAAVSVLPLSCVKSKVPEELPNILWITSEDNSAYFTNCYGNTFATTPNIDKLANQGFLYTHAYANSPVCAPARNSIITGMYAASNGNEPMRSRYKKPEQTRVYPEFLREAGYYCTNNSKTDYNTQSIDPDKIWDECSSAAHYKNRPANKPFFAVFNLTTSHESCIHESIPGEQLRHDPEKVVLAAYHPDTKEMRHDYAQYYDKVEDMDAQVGRLLKELEESGEAENTIVFYYGDNGGILARSKRYVYESGTRIPLVIRIPEKYKSLFPEKTPGKKVERLVSFVDLAPTLLSIVDIPIPDYIQGKAFLGKQKARNPEYAFMTRSRMDERFDLSRAVRDQEYRYIRNYMPFRIYGQHLDYLFRAPSARSWEAAYQEGKCNDLQRVFWNTKPVEELYKLESDPWEINNLANNPEYQDVLVRMRDALHNWMIEVKDAGLVPETEYNILSENKSMYDYMISEACPFEEILAAADIATLGDKKDLQTYTGYLKNENSTIRYWGATGLLILKNEAESAIPNLKAAAGDKSAAVATLVAEALYGLGEKDTARNIYIRILQDTLTYHMTDRNFVLNSIDAVNENSSEVRTAVQQLYEKNRDVLKSEARYNAYDMLMCEWLLNKWNNTAYNK
ncbi:MAG: sulfatase [Bacteroidales bacterium]|nr:sulfatase [Bacteroidales bacterium]